MKVVINACFGGFSLSPAAERAYLARKGKEAFFYVEDRDSGPVMKRDLLRVSADEAKKAFMSWTMTRDLGERVKHDAFWKDVEDVHYYGRDVDRSDPDLVAVVEELGDKANGSCARLQITEIPDGVEYSIEEYDGNEHVAEAHRTWR